MHQKIQCSALHHHDSTTRCDPSRDQISSEDLIAIVGFDLNPGLVAIGNGRGQQILQDAGTANDAVLLSLYIPTNGIFGGKNAAGNVPRAYVLKQSVVHGLPPVLRLRLQPNAHGIESTSQIGYGQKSKRTLPFKT
jgi:hypothetical protein